MKKARKIKNKHSIKRQKSVILSKIKAQRSKSNKEANRKRFAMIEDEERYACVEANEILYAEGDDKTSVVYVSEQRTFPLSIPIKKAIKQLRSCFEFLQKVFLGLMCSFSCVLWAIFWSFPLLFFVR